MNKTILLPLALSSLGVALLAGCTPASTASTPTSLEQEVVSSALLSQKNTASPLLLKKATASSAADLSFDATDVPGTLASFDALSLDNYTIKTNVLVSDKEDYDHKDGIVYTLADGSSKSVILYYSESKLVSTSATVSASATVNASTSATASATTDTEQAELHLYGYRHGGFDGMLQAGWSFQAEDTTNLSYSGTWKRGLAYVDDVEYRFHAEEITLTNEGKSASFTSFGLFASGRFLAVEQAAISNGSETANVYAYTAFQNANYTRYLLSESGTNRRLVYRTPLTKLVVNRFEEDDKTLYSVHLKVVGSMALVGVYEKVVTTASDGSESVSYVLYQGKESVPSED
jgi:hypothetical protein